MNKKETLKEICGVDSNEDYGCTEYIKGCSKLKVDLISGPDENIYRAMVEGTLYTWGDHKANKWEKLSPEMRFHILKECLDGKTLPLPIEFPQFVFHVSGVSRASFDQIARTRIGAVFCAKGVRDNNAKNWGVIVPTLIYDNKALFYEFCVCWETIRRTYAEFVDEGRESWQTARSVLGMNVEYSYMCAFNYSALRNLCAHRLINTEQEDTVGTVIGMWKAVFDKFPLLAAYMKPMEDIKKKNLTIEANGLSKELGLLFGGAGATQRWPLSQDEIEKYEIRFNSAAADWDILEKQIEIHFPYPNEWPVYEQFSDLEASDMFRFT